MKPLLSAAVSVAACLGAVLASAWWTERRLTAEMTMRPPVVVVDYTPIAAALGRGADPAQLGAAFAQVKEHVARFERAGYLVLNRMALEAIPPEFLIPVAAVPDGPRAAGGEVPRPPVVLPGLPAMPAPGGGALPPAGALRPAAPAGPSQNGMSQEEAAALLRSLLAAGTR